MNEKSDVFIDLEAAGALARWKSLFAEEVVAGAKRLAAESGERNQVTLSQYRQAAQRAIQSLAAAILETGPSSDNQEAA